MNLVGAIGKDEVAIAEAAHGIVSTQPHDALRTLMTIHSASYAK